MTKKKEPSGNEGPSTKEPIPSEPNAATAEDGASSSSEEDDDLVLEGVVVRNPEVPSSSDDDISSESEGEQQEDTKTPAIDETVATGTKRQGGDISRPKKKGPNDKRRKEKPKQKEPEVVNVEFTFCDMDEKFFHGLKTHLASSTIYASHSSTLADYMIENISVGTVISTDGDEDGNVYGFASVLPVKVEGPVIEYYKELCLKHCPDQHKQELEVVLSAKTRRPAGFLLHGRMINLPLEIVEVLHQQLVLDMDWAVLHAEGGDDERKSLDFGAFVRLAPSFPSGGGSPVYKYFDDDIFASHAEFVYTFDAPKGFASEEKQLCSVIVMTKTGHRESMKDLAKFVAKR